MGAGSGVTDFFATVRSRGVLNVNSLFFTDDAATGDLKTDSLDFGAPASSIADLPMKSSFSS